jgi:glycosyltransferase involved in cell wall biosynthesis
LPPLVSILLSVFNGRPYLTEAVQSILEQSFRDFELIIVDDASTDGSSTDLASFAKRDSRIKLLHNAENQGLTRSLNRGLAEARGKYIARQDADDVSLPLRFEKQLAAMEEFPNLALLGTGLIEIDAKSKKGPISLQPSLPAVIKRKMLFDNAFFHSSIMWRKDLFAEKGYAYNENLRYGQDYDLFSRVVWREEIANLPEPLILFRTHSGQVSKKRVEDQQSLADNVAWSNFLSFGLEDVFQRQEVALMRRIGIRSQGLTNNERHRQWRLWSKLFSVLEAGLSSAEAIEWKQVKRVRLKLLRRTFAARPLLLKELTGVAAMDPVDTVKDFAGILRNRLFGKDA